MRWPRLLLALLLLHTSWAHYYSDNGPRDLYYGDDEDANANDQAYNDQLNEIVQELAKGAERENWREQGFDYDSKNARDIAYDFDLLKAAENLVPKETKSEEVKTDKKEEVKPKEVVKETVEQLAANVKEQPALPQKKGQNEFVEFVEPKPEKQLQHHEQLEKRVETSHNRVYTSPIVASGNLFYIAMATLCVMAAVFGVVGGVFYYQKVRNQRIENAFSNFSHYAPTGPGKEKKKKDGDEGLAYRAQLHHYQQTKQKIISGNEQDVGIPEPDEASEASDYDENNFSVYECPGLAPTGDIEVQNPNFNSRP